MPLSKMYLRDSDAIVLVYDKSSQDFLVYLNKFIAVIGLCCDRNPSLIMVANKTDLDSSVISEEGLEICHQNGFIYTEVSAKSNINVQFLFELVATECVRRKNIITGGNN